MTALQLKALMLTLAGNFTTNLEVVMAHLKQYRAILVPISILIAMLLLLKVVRIKRKENEAPPFKGRRSKSEEPPLYAFTSKDLSFVAGDDLMTTQLDLARAYVEMEKKNEAQAILNNVMKNGNPAQQEQAKQLMSRL